jgi:hypothetical protein
MGMSLYEEHIQNMKVWKEQEPKLTFSLRRVKKNYSLEDVEVAIRPNGDVAISSDGSTYVENFEKSLKRLSRGDDEVWYVTQEMCIELFVITKDQAVEILDWLREITKPTEPCEAVKLARVFE